MTKQDIIIENFTQEIHMTSKDHSLSGLPALNYIKGDRWIYVAFDKSVDSAGGLYEVNESSIEACDGGDAIHFETLSEVSEYIKSCHYPFSGEMIEAFKQMLIKMDLFGPHLK